MTVGDDHDLRADRDPRARHRGARKKQRGLVERRIVAGVGPAWLYSDQRRRNRGGAHNVDAQ